MVSRVRKLTRPAALPADFTRNADSASWTLDQSMPGTRVVAVVGVVTNAYGDSPAGALCTTGNSTDGLVLASEGTSTLNVSTDTTLPTGDLVVNVLAVGSGPVIITLPLATADARHTVTVKWLTGNTQDVHVVEAGADTIDGSSSPVVLNASSPMWTGVAQ